MPEIPKIDMNPVKSSAVSACGFDKETGALAVKFNSGGTYYFKAKQEDYDSLIEADSFGRQWHQTKGNLSKFNDDQK